MLIISKINQQTYDVYGTRTYEVKERDPYSGDTLKLVTEFLVYNNCEWAWENADYYRPYEI